MKWAGWSLVIATSSLLLVHSGASAKSAPVAAPVGNPCGYALRAVTDERAHSSVSIPLEREVAAAVPDPVAAVRTALESDGLRSTDRDGAPVVTVALRVFYLSQREYWVADPVVVYEVRPEGSESFLVRTQGGEGKGDDWIAKRFADAIARTNQQVLRRLAATCKAPA